MISLEQPDKFCPRCGALIPSNKDIEELSDPAAPERNHSPGLLACLHCAMAAGGAPVKPTRRLSRRSLEAAGQETLISAGLPSIFIGRKG